MPPQFLDWREQGFLTAEDLRVMGMVWDASFISFSLRAALPLIHVLLVQEIAYFAASRFEALGQGLFKEKYQRSTRVRVQELGILSMNEFSYDVVFEKMMDSFIGCFLLLFSFFFLCPAAALVPLILPPPFDLTGTAHSLGAHTGR